MLAEKAAADALAQALGPELSAKANFAEVIAGLQKLGVSLEDIRAEADTLATSLKQADDVRLQGLSQGVDITRRNMDGLRNSSNQSRSVLANLAGNAAQDLGQLGGVVGSLGVGISQLAEYAVDGNIKLGQLAQVAGPMAALSAALLLVGNAQKEIAEQEAFQTEQVEAYRDAVDEVGESVEAVEQRLQEMEFPTPEESGANTMIDLLGRIGISAVDALTPWEDLSARITDFPQLMGQLGFSFEDLARVIQGGTVDLGAFETLLNQMPEAEGLVGPIMDFLTSQQEAYAAAVGLTVDELGDQDAVLRAAAERAEFYASSVEGVNQALQDFDDEASHTRELWDLVLADLAGNRQIDTTIDQWNRLRDILELTDEQMAELADQKLDERLEEIGDAAKDLREVLVDTITGIGDAAVEAREELEETATGVGEAAVEAREALEEMATGIGDAAVEGREAFEDMLSGIGAAAQEGAKQLQGLNDGLADVADNLDTAAGRAAAFGGALGGINTDLDNTTATIEFNDRLKTLHETLHDLNDAVGDTDFASMELVPDSWEEVRNMPDELRPVVEALTGFRDIMQSEFTQAFERGGSPEAIQWAQNTRRAVVDELRLAGIEAPEQVNEILDALGLLPDQVETTIRISNEAQARQILDDIRAQIEALPAETQLRVAAIAANDPIAALQLAIDALPTAGISVPVELEVAADTLAADINAKVNGSSFGAPQVTITPKADLTTFETDVAAAAAVERTSTVDVVAPAATTVDAQIDAVASQPRTAVVNVATGIVDMPSASQLAARIGTVHVTVRGVWDTRLEGTRPR
jgi:tRNA threonylcarbamoyladenosine modification (KEOPS) complex Cgi121 subunit